MQTAIASARAAALRRALRLARPSQLRTYATPTVFKEDDDPQLADYPRLPYVSKQRRPPLGWEDPQMRRNFGETLHEQEEILSMWGPDAPVVAPSQALRHFVIAFSGIAAFAGFCYVIKPPIPAVRREYPFEGLVTELGGFEENKARPESGDPDEE